MIKNNFYLKFLIMTFPKYNLDPKKIAAIIAFQLYKLTRQPTISSEVFVPKAKENLLRSLFSNPNFWGASFVVIISLNILKNIVALSHETQTETQNEKKTVDQSPPNWHFPKKSQEKRILSLHLSCPHSVDQYVIFKQKNKNNSSHVHINSGEIGQIIQKTKYWDEAIVDFSISIPTRFAKLNRKFIADQATNEAILLVEEI